MTLSVKYFFKTFRHLVIGISVLSWASARAATYPWVELKEGDIQVIPAPKVEVAFQLELIRHAHSTIDFLANDQRTDPVVGMPILVALREAADRGVQVRFMNSWFTELAGDFHKLVPRYLTEPAARLPIQVRIVGGPQAHRRGWGYADGIHDRLMVVDGAIALTTGRGQSGMYQQWLDTAFALRGGLASQSAQAFEDVWRDAGRDNPAFDRKGRYITSPIPHPWLASPALAQSESRELDRLKSWATLAAAGSAGQAPLQGASAGRGRLLHYDFFRQMEALPWRQRSYTFGDRIRLLNDPVTEALSAQITEQGLLGEQGRVRIATLSVITHPKLRDALHRALSNHAWVRILTNGRSAYGTLKIPPAPWWLSLPDMEDLLNRGAHIATMPVGRSNPWRFMHRKIAVTGNTVFFGSHNFNLASSVASDEISYEVESPELATQAIGLIDEPYKKYGWVQEAWNVHLQRRATAIGRWLSRPFLGFF